VSGSRRPDIRPEGGPAGQIQKIQAPRGTQDVLPEAAAAFAVVEATARRILEPAGFQRIETPTFEATDLFARGVGEATDIVQKEMYTFDDAGGRSITLRPEGTAPVCRAYVEHGMQKLPQPVKLWYLSSFYRYEKPQAGRFRQFWQVGVEAIGSADPAVDAEAIALQDALLRELGAREVRLRIGSLGTPQTRAEYRERLQAHLRDNVDRLSAEVAARIELNPLRAFDADDAGTREVMATAPLLLDSLAGEDREHFDEVCALLDAADVAYAIDPTLVRGLDYYARTVFEFSSDVLGAQSALGGGGRYDGLVELIGGPPTPGVGWASGIERMLLARDTPAAVATEVDLFVVFDDGLRQDAFTIVARARQAGRAAQMELAGRSIKGQLKHASRTGARFVAVLRQDGTVLQDTETNDEIPVEGGADGVVAAVLRHMGPGSL